MSSETINPIPPERFAAALQDLPLDALHAKAAELQHNMNHLRSSNAQMLEFAEQGDQDCKDAMFENLGVIGRINERVDLIRKEVESRGLPFPNSEDGHARVEQNGDAHANGITNLQRDGRDATLTRVNGEETLQTQRATNGRLTDDELRRQLEAQLAEDEEGLHL